MTSGRWRVFLAQPALWDLRKINAETVAQFGPVQARRYRSIIEAALRDLREGPVNPLIRRRDGLPPDMFLMPVRRRGAAARHLLLCKTAPESRIDVLRILHDAMDLPSHLTGLHEETALFDALR